MTDFLPVSREDMLGRGLHYVDFVCVNGDAYVDHPSFGIAVISRVLEAAGFTVGILAQPDWRDAEAFRLFGRPRFGFMVSAGNLDSMVAHYTVAKRPRKSDYYSPGGRVNLRPDRAATVYARCCKEAYPDVPVILGGLEASLRRFAHYDYWDETVHPSVLVESGADLLVYGMGELQTEEIARRLAHHEPVSSLTDIRGTCYLSQSGESPEGCVSCDAYERVAADKRAYAQAFRIQYEQQDPVTGKTVSQRHGTKLLIQNKPARPLTQRELDHVYELPYTRDVHPMYGPMGGVPAIEEVRFSITHNRGCFGACGFCSIAFHQGRTVVGRSEESVVREAQLLTARPDFKGYIHDVGGPTANFSAPSCRKQLKYGMCKGKRCLAPSPCPNLEVSHKSYLSLLRRLRALPGVKRVFIRSGLRYDYIMADPDDAFFRELIAHHISGQLKVAPEHCVASVLDRMGKPHIGAFLAFKKKFYELTARAGKEQYLVPYLMSSHPGSTLKDAIELALFLKHERIRPEQVQDFYPTPGTMSTCMFYTGLDPLTMRPVYVPRSQEEKALQRALLQYFIPANRALVCRALEKAGRTDLIGGGPDCLVPRPASAGHAGAGLPGAERGGAKGGAAFRSAERRAPRRAKAPERRKRK